jgi:hypothetical protein
MSAPQTVQRRSAGAVTTWSCAVFAHNEAAGIVACLDSVVAALAELPCTLGIHVLANGCTDRTEAVVEAYARRHAPVRLASLPVADKAAAWNQYVHVLAPDADMHLMIDGDVQAAPGAAAMLALRLAADPRAQAVAALPGGGRTRAAWTAGMRRFGRLAGNLYALRGGFVTRLRQTGIAMPRGLIGEDLFLAALVKGKPFPGGLVQPDPALTHEPRALFRFRSLSPWRPGDWLTHARRLVRYRVRDHELLLLLRHLETHGLAAMPADVEQLYAAAGAAPGFHWHGRQTPQEWLAVALLRRAMHRAKRAARRRFRHEIR